MKEYRIVLGEKFNLPDEDCVLQFEVVNFDSSKKTYNLLKLFELPVDVEKIFLNNWQSWGSCDFFSVGLDISKYFEVPPAKDFVLAFTPEPELFREKDKLMSDYFVAFSNVLIGFLKSEFSHNFFVYDKGKKTISAYVDLFGKELETGEKLVLEPLVVLKNKKIEKLLETYGALVAEKNNISADKKVRVGWCSWYHYFTNITYDELKKNIEFLKNLKEKIPYQFVQIDDGYQKDIGDWLETNSKFPEGLEGIVKSIRDAGFIPGIWLAPFSVSETSTVFKEHKDWLISDENGEPKVAYRNWEKNIYGLDLSNEEVLDWLKNLFKELKNKGFEYFKIDFLFAGAIPGKRKKIVTPIEAYRVGLKTIKDTIGDSFLLGCGAPLLPSIGIVDGMRIGADTSPEWFEDIVAPFPNSKVALRNVITRYFMNKRWWNNDPDCLLLRKEDINLPENVRRLYSFVSAALSNMVIESDDMELVDEEGLQTFVESLKLCDGEPRVFNLDTDEKVYVIGVKGLLDGNYILVANLENKEYEIEIPEDAKLWTGLREEKITVPPRDVVVVRDKIRKLKVERARRKDDNRLVNYYWDGDENC
ncbi:MAG: alpha-galactosidase [Thermotogaceae bacterium]|nr:alpha-galactosidase [Thermotogaceae bacterium]